ncbi:MAG TPA: TonB-dependent receptor [Pyrinomonadaceae bacterium]|nr:TonB-dependent receptor [Pyrinomonadaceae bacterium]
MALAAHVFTQTAETGTIRGSVVDPTGAVIPGARVSIDNESTGLSRETVADDEGNYFFTNLPLTGLYRISAASKGFITTTKSNIELKAGGTATVDFYLEVGVINDLISVTVLGTTDSIQTDSAQLGTRLDLQKIDNTPVLNRRITNLVELNSAIRPARGTGDLFVNNYLFVANGSGRRQTTFTLDGSTGNDSWGRQTLFTALPLSTLQEFTVLTNPVSAEFGRTSGNVVNIVTKSGTNEFGFDGVAMIRPSGLQASQPLAPRRTRDELVQFSGVVSGPIIKDRTHFLIGAEGNWQRRDTVITSPLAPGTYPGKYRQGLFLARVDHQLNRYNTLTGRFNLDNFTDFNANDSVGGNNLSSAARLFQRATYAAQISETAVFNSNIVNQARFQFQFASPITKFSPITPSTQFVRTGFSTEGESRSALLTNRQYQFADTVSLLAGKHAVKIGGDLIHSSSGGDGQEFGGGFVLGQFTFPANGTDVQNPNVPTSALPLSAVSRYTQSFGTSTYNVNEWLWSLFVQDDWRVRGDLTLNLGLRYERQTFTDDTNNVAPRVGFAYNVLGDGKTVIRGSYGIFYSEVRANTAASFALNGPTGVFTFSATPGGFGFPTSFAPLPAFPEGAILPARDITIRPGRAAYYSQFFDISKLTRYPDKLLNPETYQGTIGVQRELRWKMFLSADYVYAHTIRIDRTIDLNAPLVSFTPATTNQSRSTAAADATRPIIPVNNGYKRILGVVNEGMSLYNGLQMNLEKRFTNKLSFLASYTLSKTSNTVEFDAPGGDPNDVNFLGEAELGTSLLDQRHRFVFSGYYKLPYGFTFGGVTTAASGRPFNITAGRDTNGDGANTDRPFDLSTGNFLPRNSGKGTPTYSTDLFVQKGFAFGENWKLEFRAEGFNIFNHPNIYGRNGSYGSTTVGTPSTTLGAALGGISNVDPGREFQFQVRLRY